MSGSTRRSGNDETAAFRPPPWLRGPNAQTVVGRFLRLRLPYRYRRERLELSDGDFLDLDVARPIAERGEGEEGPDDGLSAASLGWALLLHGLEGSSDSGYMRQACLSLARDRIVAVALNFRSCSGEPNRLLRSYHSGSSDDVAVAVSALTSRFGTLPFGIIGFSLGANVLLKYLGEAGADAPGTLLACAAVSSPFDLAACARHLERGWGRLYTHYFLGSMKEKALEKAARFPGALDPAAIRRARTLREFDEAVTAPVHGFRDAAEYYEVCSSRRYLADIRVPTLCVQALDDPFIPDSVPIRKMVESHPHLIPALTERGGHVGWVGDSLLPPVFWCEETAAAFLAARFRDLGAGTKPREGGWSGARPPPAGVGVPVARRARSGKASRGERR